MRSFIVFAITLAVAAAAKTSERIIGGSLTTIEEYPEMVALLRVWGNYYAQYCGGSILNNRAILTAAHCLELPIPAGRRVRVGSSYQSSNGTVYSIERIIIHPGYANNWPAEPDNDLSILWLTDIIPVTPTSRPALIAGPNYNLADNEPVWAIGWGWTEYGNFTSHSEQLRHVQVYTVNQEICRQRFANRVVNGVPMPYTITDNMLCSGILDVGGRDQCYGDSGGPVFHHGVQVGICSFGHECALGEFPGVNVRVSQYTNWISDNR
ncbi:trypsin, alkaline C-like [Ostrinia furnacalis]|uniref:trypsin, alkaline C-like n=1 Tax=Ostrinia furnacalis TaxID=93504 RepID=UPI001040A3F1|nr:trypsin, alkaline C-like [Ostrinia furnacalis]